MQANKYYMVLRSGTQSAKPLSLAEISDAPMFFGHKLEFLKARKFGDLTLWIDGKNSAELFTSQEQAAQYSMWRLLQLSAA